MSALHQAILNAYCEELQNNYHSVSSEHDGKLDIPIDTRCEIKAKHIKPTLPAYDQFVIVSRDDSDEEFIMSFEEDVEELMVNAEQQVVDHIISTMKDNPFIG